jgi:RNase P subunit RPR2
MKCKNCNTCLKVIRIDYTENSEIYWYCTLCKKVYNFNTKKEIVDEENINKVREYYQEKYGKRI